MVLTSVELLQELPCWEREHVAVDHEPDVRGRTSLAADSRAGLVRVVGQGNVCLIGPLGCRGRCPHAVNGTGLGASRNCRRLKLFGLSHEPREMNRRI